MAPLGVSLVALALLVPAVASRFGLRNAMTGGMALSRSPAPSSAAAISGGGLILLGAATGAVGAVSVANWTRVGHHQRLHLSRRELRRRRRRRRVRARRFGAVLVMIALAGIIGAVLSRWIPKAG